MAKKKTSTRSSLNARAAKAPAKKPNLAKVHDGIAKRLWQAAENADLTLRGVAQATGFHHESVRRWFVGMNAVAIAFIDPFCKATGTSIEWLVTGRGQMGK